MASAGIYWTLRRGRASSQRSEIVFEDGARRIVLRGLGAEARRVLVALARRPHSEEVMLERIVRRDGHAGLSKFLVAASALDARKAIIRTVRAGRSALLTLESISPYFMYSPRLVDDGRLARWSRFAYLRTVDGCLVAESPRSHARLRFDDPRVAALP
jgi:hypothetical protein